MRRELLTRWHQPGRVDTQRYTEEYCMVGIVEEGGIPTVYRSATRQNCYLYISVDVIVECTLGKSRYKLYWTILCFGYSALLTGIPMFTCTILSVHSATRCMPSYIPCFQLLQHQQTRQLSPINPNQPLLCCFLFLVKTFKDKWDHYVQHLAGRAVSITGAVLSSVDDVEVPAR